MTTFDSEMVFLCIGKSEKRTVVCVCHELRRRKPKSEEECEIRRDYRQTPQTIKMGLVEYVINRLGAEARRKKDRHGKRGET